MSAIESQLAISTTIIIDEYQNLKEIRNEILKFTPESVYYDRNIYAEEGKVIGQEISFDIDSENLTCPIYGTLDDKMKRGQGSLGDAF